MIKLADLVDTGEYGILTGAEVLDLGLGLVTEVKNWGNKGKTKYLLILLDMDGEETGAWEIRQKAYESRKNKHGEL